MLRVSIDDASYSDEHMAELSKKYGFECIFFWPVEWHTLAHMKGYDPLDFETAKQIAQNHEIGSHTITHPVLTRVETDNVIYEVIKSKDILEALFGVEVTKFAFPRGYTNQYINRLVYTRYSYARRTVGIDDDGYTLVHVHPESGANRGKHWQELTDVENLHLWCHGWEMDYYQLWNEFEKFIMERV